MNSEAVPRRGWGPFTGRQLTVIASVAVVALVVMIPTAAMAASGLFTSTTPAPALVATNSSPVANSVGALGRSIGAGNDGRTGVLGSTTGTNGVGVQGNGAKYGVLSNGPLGVAAGKTLVCTKCVTAGDIANRMVVNFNLAAGAVSGPITLPAGVPVSVTGAVLTLGIRGVASATLLRVPTPSPFIEWVGLESPLTPSITSGDTSTTGQHILYLDFDHAVDLQVNDATSVRVSNGSLAARSGTLTFTW